MPVYIHFVFTFSLAQNYVTHCYVTIIACLQDSKVHNIRIPDEAHIVSETSVFRFNSYGLLYVLSHSYYIIGGLLWVSGFYHYWGFVNVAVFLEIFAHDVSQFYPSFCRFWYI